MTRNAPRLRGGGFLLPAPPLPTEAGAAAAVRRLSPFRENAPAGCDALHRTNPFRENAMPGGPQTARHCSIQNIFSAIDAQSSAARILNRPSAQRCCGAGFCLPQAGMTLRWARGREGCSDSPLPTSGLHPPRNGKGAARPFQTPKRKSNRKKSSRFAQRFFLGSPSETPQPLRRQLPQGGAGSGGRKQLRSPAAA